MGGTGHAVNPSMGARQKHPCFCRSRTPHPMAPRYVVGGHGKCRINGNVDPGSCATDCWGFRGDRLSTDPIGAFPIPRGVRAFDLPWPPAHCLGRAGVGLRDRRKHGCFLRAPKDGFTACPANSPRHAQTRKPGTKGCSPKTNSSRASPALRKSTPRDMADQPRATWRIKPVRYGNQTRPNTSAALVPPKPKLFDMTVFNCAFSVSRTIGKPSTAGSSSPMLAEPATKPSRIISRQ